MEREERYIVLKKSDLKAAVASGRLLPEDLDEINNLQASLTTQRFLDGKKPFECVVVEHDWPEYEPVWKMIEARVNMENQHQAIKLNEGVMHLATLIAQACVQDAHEEGYDIEAGMFGPNLSKILVDANEWRKKAELLGKLRETMGYIQNGTDQVVHIFQDDATRSYMVTVGTGVNRQGVSAPSFETSILMAHHKFGGQ